MGRTPLNTLVRVTLLLVLLSSVTAKSINQRSTEIEKENEVENIDEHIEEKVPKIIEPILMNPVEEKHAKAVGKSPEVKKEEIGEKTTEKPPTNEKKEHEKPANQTMEHKAIDPTATIDTSDSTRPSRTIGQLREVESPATLIENFRNKLKAARSNLEESIAARRQTEPRRFILDPNADKIKPIPRPTLSTMARTAQETSIPDVTPTETEPQKPTEESNIKKIITSPIIDDSSSSEEEHQMNKQKTEVLNETSAKARQNPAGSEDISHLLHVRDEINKIRHMMQALREQQLRQQFGGQFPHSKNLTEEETQNLASLIEKMKDQGKISTNPLNAQQDEGLNFQNHPPETTKLIEDIKKLKQSVLSFAKQVGGPIGNIEDLEKQIQHQKEEIDNLKKLVDDLQPPRHFPSNPVMLKHPQNVKSDLHQELRSLQDILNELLTKEEKKDLRSSHLLRNSEPPQKTDEEIRTLMKIFHSMAHSGGRQSTIETKLEKLERELKEMDSQHQRTRQELLLQKLQQDVKTMKTSPKFLADQEEDIRKKISPNQPLKKTDSMSSKILALENQLKQMEKPQTRGLDLPGNIEQELDNLQREIDLMTLKTLEKNNKSGEPLSSRQLESLFTDILNPSVDDSSPLASLGKLVNIPKPTIDISHEIHPPTSSIVHTETVDIPAQPGCGQPAIFQLPFCLQKNPHSHSYVLNNPQYPPYPSSRPSIPVTIETTDYKHKHPIKTQQQTSGGYGQYPVKTTVETTEYHQPIKPEHYPAKETSQYQQPIKTQKQPSGGYGQYPAKVETNEYHQPIKTQKQPGYYPAKVETNKYEQSVKPQYAPQQVKVEERPKQYNGYQQPIKIEEPIKYSQPEYGKKPQTEGYNNEEHHPIKIQNEAYNSGSEYNKETPIIHHVYQPSVPKATPVKIEYHPAEETEEHQEYEYPVEEVPYQQYKPPYQHQANIEEEMDHLNGMIGDLNEKIDYSQDLEPNYDLYRSKNYKPRSKRSIDNDYDKNTLYKDIRQRLATLREAVQSVQDNQSLPNTPANNLNSDFQRSAYSPDSYQQYDPKDSYAIKYRKKQKFDDLFIKIVKFILHKLEISAPFVVESLFNGEAFQYENGGYDNGYGYGRSASEENGDYDNINEENNIQKPFGFGGLLNSFQGFNGLLGFIPTILFKLLSNFSSFLTILKRNNFFKNLLFPGALILAVDGIMALLVWWFSTDENHNVINFLNNNNVHDQY